jgi:5-methylcytosine-specific restriction endonuclease McrA
VGKLVRLQQGRCAACGLYLTDADVLELDHFIPRRLGGTDTLNHLQVLHRHCHDRKTAQEGSSLSRADGVLDNELES